MVSTIERLARWYAGNCDGTWEHSFGIAIGTLDNPGWSVTVDLDETPLADRPFAEVRDRYEHDAEWMRCWKEGTKFRVACGPPRLEEALNVFLEWAERAG